MYEGYGPSGVAVLIECLTDNRNRAAIEVRTAMTRNGGSMADPGSVSYLFNRKGVVIVPKADGVAEDDVLLAVLDAGAEEVNDLGEAFEVISEATDLVPVRTALQRAGIDYDSAETSFLPSVQVPLDEDGARKVFRLIDALEDTRRRAERLRQLRRQRRDPRGGRRRVRRETVTPGSSSRTGRTGSRRRAARRVPPISAVEPLDEVEERVLERSRRRTAAR